MQKTTKKSIKVINLDKLRNKKLNQADLVFRLR